MSAISKTPKLVNINEDPALAYLNQHTTYTVVPPIENATSAIQSEPITQLVTNVFQVNPPSGTNGSIQFNANGTYIGDTGLQFDPITDTFTTGSVLANSITINGNANNLKLLGGVNRNVLTTDGNGNLSWSDVLPARSGNTGKFLVTNGVSTEWSSMPYSNFATTTDVANAINNLVGTAPGILDTLGEIANVIGQTNNPEYGIISQLANKANITSLAQVAFSGSYLDLSYKPTISTAGTTGNYEDLHHLPSIPTRLMDLGISDGANGAILTTNGNGAFSFTAPSTVTDRLVNSGRAVTLSSTGQLNLPSANNENSTDNARIHSVKNIDILADMSLWTFSTTGNITFPDNTRQTSAWTGNVAYADITGAPAIPSDTTDLTNGANFITSSELNGYATETWVQNQGYSTSSLYTDSNVTALLGHFGSNNISTTGILNVDSIKLASTISGDVPTVGYSITVTSNIDGGTPNLLLGNSFYITRSSDNQLITSGWTMKTADNTSFTVTNAFPTGPGESYWQVAVDATNIGKTSSDFWPLTFTSPNYLPSSSHAINIETNSNTWQFSIDGNLTLPVGGRILDSNGASVLGGTGTIPPANVYSFLAQSSIPGTTDTYNASTNVDIIIVDSNGGFDAIIALPANPGNGKQYTIKKSTAFASHSIIVNVGSANLDGTGAGTITFNNPFGYVTLVYDTNAEGYWIIGGNYSTV